MKVPKLVQRALRVATGWIPGLGTLVEETLDHLTERGERHSTFAKLLDFDDHVWRPDSSPAALLRADFGVVPFHGRESELADLAAWCEADRPLALRMYTAPGGFGKTRLLRHFVAQRRGDGWDGGFLREGTLDEGSIEVLFGAAKKPLLLVMDYAESRRDEVEAVVRAARASGRKVRVVLLARSEGDWWEALRRAGDGVGDFFQGPAVDSPLRLSTLTDSPELRRESYEKAVQAFAETLKKPVEMVPAPQLDDDDFERVLLIHAAALAAVEGERIAAGGLLDWLLQRERRGIQRVRRQQVSAGDEMQRGIEHAAALVTLAAGADSRADVLSIISRVPSLADQPRAILERIAEALHVLYRGRRWCDGVEPDLVGEHLVSVCLHDAPELVEAAFGEGVPEERLDAGLTVLNRLAQRQPEERTLLQRAIEHAPARLALAVVRVAIAGGDPIGVVLAGVLARTDDHAVARLLDGPIPRQTTVLREVAAEVDRILLAAVDRSGASNDEEARSAAAGRLNNLSNRLASLGRREDTLGAIEKAVDIYRDLVGLRPDAFRSDLSGSLNNLSNALSNLGRREDALRAIEEAVDIYGDLAAARPDAFRPDLALSLNNLSHALSVLERSEEALAAIQEAVDIHRDLADARPHTFRPDLALSLNNLSNALSDVRRPEDALAAIQEAVDIRRDLAATRPDAFRPDLASSLNNLSNRLSDLGRREDALAAIEEAVDIYRDLAAARPDAFRPNLARSLSVLHDRLRQSGELTAALDATNQALDLLEPFFRRHLAAFAGLMGVIVNDCERTAADLGVEPDRPRLQAIREILATVQHGD